MKKIVNLAFAASFCFTLAGCYGPFALTKKLHKWNGTIGDKWANEAVFLVVTLVPVYSVTALADALVFNSIEFWGGKNPVTARQTRSVEKDGRQAVMTYSQEKKRMRIDMFESGRLSGTIVLEPGKDGNMTAKDSKGNLLSSAVNPDGTVTITGSDGRVAGVYNAEDAGRYLN